MNSNSMICRATIQRWAILLLIVGTLSLVVAQPAMACPTCKEAVAENGQNQEGLVRGYFWSIVFMMSMPFLILCGLGYYFSWQVRKARAQQLLATAGEAVVQASARTPDPASQIVLVDRLSTSKTSPSHHQKLLHP